MYEFKRDRASWLDERRKQSIEVIEKIIKKLFFLSWNEKYPVPIVIDDKGEISNSPIRMIFSFQSKSLKICHIFFLEIS